MHGLAGLDGDVGFTHSRVQVANVLHAPQRVKGNTDPNIRTVSFVDIGRSDLNSWLAALSNKEFSVFFVSLKSSSFGQLAASGSLVDAANFAQLGTVEVNAIAAADATVASLSVFIHKSSGFQAVHNGSADFTRPLGFPIPAGQWLGADTGVNWIGLMCVSYEEFRGLFDDQLLVPFFVAVGVICILAYVLFSFSLPSEVTVPVEETSKLSKLAELNEFDHQHVSLEVLEQLHRECSGHVLGAYQHYWRRFEAVDAVHSLTGEGMLSCQMQFVKDMIRDSFEGQPLQH